jgi:hypothetical protein
VEEDLLPEALHHLDAGLDEHKGRGDGQAELNPDADLGSGRGSSHGEQECKRDG